MKNEIILFENKEQCCGCGACVSVCPKKAISMQEDSCGFKYPQIDEKKTVQRKTFPGYVLIKMKQNVIVR